MFDCDLEFQEEKEFYPESEDDDLEVNFCECSMTVWSSSVPSESLLTIQQFYCR